MRNATVCYNMGTLISPKDHLISIKKNKLINFGPILANGEEK